MASSKARDFDEMIDLAAGFLACGDKLPAGKRMAICTASGGAGVWMADACVRAGLEVPELDAATRAAIDVHLPSYGTSQNPINSTAQGVHKLGYARLCAARRAVAANRRCHGGGDRAPLGFPESDLPKLMALAHETKKPVFMWTYTLPSERSIEILSEAGYPLFTNLDGCARAMRTMADYRAMRERQCTAKPAASAITCDRNPAAKHLHAAGPVLSEWQARPVLAAYGISGGEAGQLVHSAAEAETAARSWAGPVALKVQSANIPHKTEAGAVALNIASDGARAAYEHVLAAAKKYTPQARIDGVLVQPMAPPGREVILGVNRDATWGPC